MKHHHDNGVFRISPCPPLNPGINVPLNIQPRFQAKGEMAWQLSQVQTVASTARKLAVPIKFYNIIT